MNNIPYLLALHSIDGLGPIRLKALIEYFKDPKVVWEANGSEVRAIGIPKPTVDLLLETRKKLNPEEYEKSIVASGIKWTTLFDDEYPASLKQIYDPPIILYYKGEILPSDEKAIAIVGTRKMTGYGKAVTEQFTKGLVLAGLTVVSGLARGVDTQAHKTSLEEGGRTLAILGGGLNQIFPPENTDLAKKIAGGYGAVISEFPPGYPSVAGNFPARNRVISGLSKAVLVTEAASDSGSLITARLALEQGREVYAVPGPITSQLSVGPIDLIKEGARPVSDVSDILDDLGIGSVSRVKAHVSREKLTESEKSILNCLENESMHMDEICRRLNIASSVVSSALLKMEIAGFVQNIGAGTYCMTKE